MQEVPADEGFDSIGIFQFLSAARLSVLLDLKGPDVVLPQQTPGQKEGRPESREEAPKFFFHLRQPLAALPAPLRKRSVPSL